MHPVQLYNNVKRGFTYHRMTRDFFRSLRGAIQKDLLELQNSQLFDKSVGADNKPLGTYDYNNKKYNGHVRKVGQRYEMKNTGELFDKMQVKINVGRREIEFINRRKELEKPWFRYNLDVFGTSDWFGLTEENFAKFMEDYAKPWIRQYTLNHIRHGETKPTPRS
jgi:hypothetical protein